MKVLPATQLAAGDRDAFAALYDRLGHAQYKTAFSLTRSQHEAEDVIHDIFIDLATFRQGLLSIRNIDAYVFTMLRHAVIRRHGRRKIVSLQ